MARDGMGAIQVLKTQAASTANSAVFTFTFSGDCGSAKAIELRSILYGLGDPAGATSATPMSPFCTVITQTSKTLKFYGDLRGSGPGHIFPDGWDLFASDGDTVTVTVNFGGTTNSVDRYMQLRALIRAI